MRAGYPLRRKGFWMRVLTGIALILLGVVAPTEMIAYAAGGGQEENTCAASIHGAPAEMSYSFYRVAEYRSGHFLPADGFEPYPVYLGNLGTEELRAAAETYTAYVRRDHIAPRAQGKSDIRGKLRVDFLPAGLYLVLGGQVASGQKIYTPEPVLVTLFSGEAVGGGAKEIEIKYSVREIPPGSHSGGGNPPVPVPPAEEKPPVTVGLIDISLTVRKIWKDGGSEADRPARIRADLLKDGEIYDVAELTRENGWTYTWKNMDPLADYRIAEEVPAGYSVVSVRDGTTFFLTNYRGRLPSELARKRISRRAWKTSGAGERLPQTGQPWRRVALCAVFGLFFFLLAGAGVVGNLRESRAAGHAAFREAVKAEKSIRSRSEELRAARRAARRENAVPDYVLEPEISLPVVEVDGDPCVGVLEIPALGMKLPVGAETSEDALRRHPCLYSGTAYREDMVICGHNYRSQMGAVKRMPEGTEIRFTDADGNMFFYELAAAEILKPEEVGKATDGSFPLTLITCTAGGEKRCALRCRKESGR